MFGKVASDVLGLSDIGSVIKPEDFNKVDSDDYIMHEENEKIYFLIKSKTDEYCFTNVALVHLDGTSAMSKKRTLRRLTYSRNMIHNVLLETAGTVDLDVEIKFTMGEANYSIDVHKKHIAEIKDLYKALLKIAEIQHENDLRHRYTQQSIETTVRTFDSVRAEVKLEEQFKAVNQYNFEWLLKAHEQYVRKDFGKKKKKFINN